MKITEKQRNTLIEYLKHEEALVSGKFTSSFTFKHAEEKWREISAILNGIPGGATKDWKNWRKTWQDLRSRTKTKFSKIRNSMRATGGGPQIEDTMSITDNDIMAIIKPVCLSGHQEVEESVVEMDMETLQHAQKNYIPCIDLELEATAIENETTKLSESSTTKRTIRQPNKFKSTQNAVASYEQTLKRKLDIKEKYYNAKIKLLEEQIKILKENGEQIIKELKDIRQSIQILVSNKISE